MIAETLLGTLFGGAFRLAPEILKWMDRKDERAHEVKLLDKSIEADRLKLEANQKLAETQADERISLADMQALIEGVKAQGAQTGIGWVDAINSLVRPVLALQWLILLWPAAVVAGFSLAVSQGVPPLDALVRAFGTEEKALACSIASFWLVDRSLRKMSGK